MSDPAAPDAAPARFGAAGPAPEHRLDALMAALVAAVLAQAGDAQPRLAAALADRFRAPGAVAAGAALALLAASLVACALGAAVGPRLTPEAGGLFVALALLLQGGGALFRAKPPDRLERWRLGAFGTAAAGLFVLAFGDGLQFVVLALAARARAPWLAAPGAVVGSLLVIAPAAVLGARGWEALPLRAFRLGGAALFLLAGAWVGLAALGLV